MAFPSEQHISITKKDYKWNDLMIKISKKVKQFIDAINLSSMMCRKIPNPSIEFDSPLFVLGMCKI